MQYMKYLFLPLFLLTSGCLTQTATMEAFEYPEISPVLMEINSVPQPFDLNGRSPYVLWVNGSRVDLPMEDLAYLVNKIGAKNIRPIEIADIHQGWLFPHFVKLRELDSPQNKRIRIVK